MFVSGRVNVYIVSVCKKISFCQLLRVHGTCWGYHTFLLTGYVYAIKLTLQLVL